MKDNGALHVLRIKKRDGTLVELGIPFAVILIVLIVAIFGGAALIPDVLKALHFP